MKSLAKQDLAGFNRREFLGKSAKMAILGGAFLAFGADKLLANSDTKGKMSDKKETKMQFVTLNNGVKMPILGYGVYQIPPKETQKCVEDALSVGYRLIDTAYSYHNEEGVGAAVKTAINGGVKREDLFIATKLWISFVSEKEALKGFEISMKRLNLEYLDLLLIHQPLNDFYGAWRVMSKLHKEGRIRAIGVSNFMPDRLMDLCIFNEIKPTVNQIECHAFHAGFDAQKNMQNLGVAMQSWGSFAEGRNDFFKKSSFG